MPILQERWKGCNILTSDFVLQKILRRTAENMIATHGDGEKNTPAGRSSISEVCYKIGMKEVFVLMLSISEK